MSELSISDVINTAQAPASGMLAASSARAMPAMHRSDGRHTSPAANGSSLASLIGAADLPAVVRRAFDLDHDHVVSDLPVLAEFSGKRLRFDLDHQPAAHSGDRAAHSRGRASHSRRRSAAGELLSAALGLVSARDVLQARNWVVLVIDSRQGAVQWAQGVLASLGHLRRFLIIWCEGDSPPPIRFSAATRPWEQFLAETGLAQVGPVAAAHVDGIVALIQALKALDQSVLLRLKISDTSPQEVVPASQGNGKAPRNGHSRKINGRLTGLPQGASVIEAAGVEDLPGTSAAGEFTNATPRCAIDAAVRAIAELAAADRRIVAVSLSSDARLARWQHAHAAWFLRPPGDVHALTWCAGLAKGDCRPIIFLGDESKAFHGNEVMEALRDSKLPLTMLAPARTMQTWQRISSDAPEHNEDLPLFPGALVMAPSTTCELTAMLRFSADHGQPAMIALPDQFSDHAAASFADPIVLGTSQQLLSGGDLALVGWGPTLDVACGAAFELARRGIHAAVINLRFLEPLDRRLILETGRRVRGMVLLEDQSLRLDVSGRLLRLLASDRRTAPVAHCVIRREAHRDAYDAAIADVVNRCLRLTDRPPVRRRPLRLDAKAAGSPPRLHSLRPLPSPDAERAAVISLEISRDVQRWVETYGEVGKRNPYLWRWARRGVELTTLPFVRDELRADVCDSKVLSIMLCVLLDDVADEHGKSRLLDCLFQIMAERSMPDLTSLSAEERGYTELVRRLTDEYEERIARYPRHERYAELLRYDAAQFVNTLRYSHLLNRNIHLLNLAEHDLYLPHNMHMMSFATLDLMCSHDFPDQELGKLREAIWHAQCMGRIGNLLSTWRREVKQRDFTSGVFARAVMQGDLTIEQLSEADAAGIERAIDGGRHEQYFVERWQRHRHCFQRAATRIEAVDLEGLVESHDRFLQMHLSSRGLI